MKDRAAKNDERIASEVAAARVFKAANGEAARILTLHVQTEVDYLQVSCTSMGGTPVVEFITPTAGLLADARAKIAHRVPLAHCIWERFDGRTR